MSPEYRRALLITAKALPADCIVPVPAGRLLELLAGSEEPVAPDAPAPDFTVEQVAQRFGRAASTVRGWVASGHLAGAYHFRGRQLRIPAAAVLAFEEQQRGPDAVVPVVNKPGSQHRKPDLGAWRGLAS